MIYQASSRPPVVGLHRHGSKSAATFANRYVSLSLLYALLTPVLCSSARIRGWVLADITLDFSAPTPPLPDSTDDIMFIDNLMFRKQRCPFFVITLS